MSDDFGFNERYSVEARQVGQERQPVLIVDDCLRDPEALVRYAANEARFKPSTSAYPGIVAPTPEAYVDALVRFLLPMLGEPFGVKVETAYLANSFFAMHTIPREQLHFRQRLPHVDLYVSGQIAVLHYLCDSSQGGTALYRHRATGYESLNETKKQHMEALIALELAKQPIPADYPNAGTRLFEQTAIIEAKFNRLFIMRSEVLHAGHINANTNLNPNPRIGRLTANTFLRFELA